MSTVTGAPETVRAWSSIKRQAETCFGVYTLHAKGTMDFQPYSYSQFVLLTQEDCVIEKLYGGQDQ